MRILICGLGSIGRRHFRNLRALGVEELFLLRTGRSTLPDDELEGIPVEVDIHRALERWNPDAVVVSNPTALHLEVAIPAARVGCHLLLEKPVSHNLLRIPELREAVRHGGGEVLIGFQFRFNPGLQQVKKWVVGGAVGRPLSSRSHWGEYLPGWHPWEDYRHSYAAREDLGGGVTLTLSHPFDYLHWIFGPVRSLWGAAGKGSELGIEVEDTLEAILEMESGMLASLHLDYNQRPNRHDLEIIGSKGTILWEAESSQARLWDPQAGDWEVFYPPEDYERNAMFIEEARNFLQVIQGEEAPICSLEEGLYALQLSLAALRSARECRLVEMPGGSK